MYPADGASLISTAGCGRRIFWIDLNRFDTKPDKSTWVEMGAGLAAAGYDVAILAGREKGDYQPPGPAGPALRYFSAIDAAGLFRITLLINIARWCLQNTSPEDIIILPPGGLLCAPFLRLFGRRNLHLDVRTVPVEIRFTMISTRSISTARRRELSRSCV